MVADTAVTVPIIAVCAKDGYLWVLGPDRDRCMVCGEPPQGVVATRVLDGSDSAASAEAAKDEPGALDEPAVFGAECPGCHTDLEIVATADSVGLRIPEPSNASPPSANGTSERMEASSPGDDVDGAGEPAAGHTNPPAAGSPPQEEHDATADDEQSA